MITLLLLACATTESPPPTTPPPPAPIAEPAAGPVEIPAGPRLAVAGELWCAVLRSGEVRCGSVEGVAAPADQTWEVGAMKSIEAAGLRDVRALRLGTTRLVTLHTNGDVRVLATREGAAFPAFPAVTGTYQGLSRGGGAQALCAIDPKGEATCWSDEWTVAAAPAGPFVALADDLNGDVCGLHADGSLACWSTSDGKGRRRVLDPAGPFRALALNVNGLCLEPVSGSVDCGSHLPGGAADMVDLVVLTLNPGDPTALPELESACGISSAGALRCWGNVGEPPAGRFVDVASEDDHTCALREDDQVLCWKHPKFYETGPGPGD